MYKRAGLTSDVIIRNKKGQYLFIRRGGELDINDPSEPGKWALPGGFHEYGERIETTAVREIKEETGLTINPNQLILVGVYSDPDRDKRGHAVDIVFMIQLEDSPMPTAGDDAKEAGWFFTPPGKLAFDHETIFNDALEKMSMSVQYGLVYFDANAGEDELWHRTPDYLFKDKKKANAKCRELNNAMSMIESSRGDRYKTKRVRLDEIIE